MSKLHLFKLLFILILPYLSSGNFVCLENEYLDENNDFKELYIKNILKSDTIRQTHSALISDYISVVNKSILQDEYVFNTFIVGDVLRSGVTPSSTISTVYRFQNWLIPRFVYNYNIVMLDFEIPKDTRDIIFVFIAREIKMNNIGGDCQPKGIEMVLRPHGLPISNITMPENFVTNMEDAQEISFQSNNAVQTIRIQNPTMGSWFARVYKTWTNPIDDPLEQQGLAASCETFISGEVSVQVQSMVNPMNCDQEVQINLSPTETAITDHYSCFISTESTRHTLRLSINLNAATEFVILRLQGKKLTSDSSLYQCGVKLDGVQNQKLSLMFTPYIKKWHYLGVTYGKNASNPLPNIQICEDFTSTPNRTSISKLVRFSKPGLFLFEYQTPIVRIVPGELQTLKFDIQPTKDMGGALTIEASINNNETLTIVDVVVCVGRDKIFSPNADKKCQSDFETNEPDLILNSGDERNMSKVVHIPYPDVGTWYVTFGSFGAESITEVNVKISSSPCSNTGCGKFGACQVVTTGNLVLSACRCSSAYTGWICSDDYHVASRGESLTIILLLTLSNLFFIPSVVFAIRRKYFAEALVYALTMFFSIFYHACDSTNAYYGLCITKFGVLQYADFFCGILSFWVTLVAMASLNKTIVSVLHVLGAVLIAFGTELNRFSFLLFLIPILSGFIIIVVSWIYHCKLSGRLFPGKRYLMFFFPAGVVLAGVGLVCFAFLQTVANYHIVHSIWHITVALSVLILLPIRSFFFTDEYAPTDTGSPFNTILQNTNY